MSFAVQGTVNRIYPTASNDGNTEIINFRIKTSSGLSPYYKFPFHTEQGKATYALLLSCAQSKTPVNVVLKSDGENIYYIYVDYQ